MATQLPTIIRAVTPGAIRRVARWAILLFLVACDSSSVLPRLGETRRTGYERYVQALRAADLATTALGAEWLAASDSALRDALPIALPAREVAVYSRSEARAVAYAIRLRDGERLRVTLRVSDTAAPRLYLDLYERMADTARAFEHRATADGPPADGPVDSATTLSYEARRSADYVIRVQPELLRAGRFELTVRTEPMLAFPVEGAGNAAIQSLYGAVRDGGRRDHHGIDIFSPRGTPVVAATSGIVRSVAPNRLGGNVVWLADVRRGQSLYYAHLDRHAVVAGQRVEAGDTLGFVGNTGNARTTPPHLHFGIYRRGAGPVDPLYYVRTATARLPAMTADAANLGSRAVVRGTTARLRSGTATANAPANAPERRVRSGTSLLIMAAAGPWYRVQMADGTTGYLSPSTLRVVAAPSRDFSTQ